MPNEAGMSSSDDPREPKASGGRCPICGKPTVHAIRPFCSVRCADIDLGRWVGGAYVITGGESDADEDGDEGIAKELGSLDRGEGPDEER
jgi:endogenous inhibitor of DNA gyrase (YacG/DUF329 family)